MIIVLVNLLSFSKSCGCQPHLTHNHIVFCWYHLLFLQPLTLLIGKGSSFFSVPRFVGTRNSLKFNCFFSWHACVGKFSATDCIQLCICLFHHVIIEIYRYLILHNWKHGVFFVWWFYTLIVYSFSKTLENGDLDGNFRPQLTMYVTWKNQLVTRNFLEINTKEGNDF